MFIQVLHHRPIEMVPFSLYSFSMYSKSKTPFTPPIYLPAFIRFGPYTNPKLPAPRVFSKLGFSGHLSRICLDSVCLTPPSARLVYSRSRWLCVRQQSYRGPTSAYVQGSRKVVS